MVIKKCMMIRYACTVIAAVLALSCSNDDSPQFRSDIEFKECHLYAEDGNCGQTRFMAWTGESHMTSDFTLELFFDKMAGMETGEKAAPVHIFFADVRVNGTAGFTSEFSGSIELVKRSETEAEIVFDEVTMNIVNTDYRFDGCLRCPIE